MPLLAMFVARLMMIVAVIGSVSMYFYLYVLRYSPVFGRPHVVYLRPPVFQWDRADHRNVIIVTDSALDPNIIGNLFNEHPNVFYVEQPLYPFEMFKHLNYTRESEYNGQVRAFLDNLFHCRFNGYKDYLTFLSHPGLSSPRFRLSSKALSSPPLCKKEVKTYTNESDFLKDCPVLNAKWVSIVCARKMHIVLSMFARRAPGGGLAGLAPLMTSQSMATRVLHLVRDPRAVVWEMISNDGYSEKDLHQGMLEDKIKNRCNQLSKDIDFPLSLPSDLTDQYMVMRYEDASGSIARAAKTAFDSAGIDIDAEVNGYILRQGQKSVNSENDRSWRLTIDMKLVPKIEHHCAHVMKTLGYKTVAEEHILRNLYHSLLESNVTL